MPESDSPHYHVFLSHNSRDKGAVEPLAVMLKEKGLNPFLDKWNLVPGEPVEDALIEALENSDSAVIFVGPGGEGPWQSEEMRDILKRAVKSHNEFRAIPVLLPNASAEVLEKSFLGSRLWIEFESVDDEAALRRMAKAIQGEASGDGGFELPDEPAPYRGLERFERIENPEEDFFFGRDDEIRALVERLVKERFVAVVGASGSGKSSLVRAGLTKQLAEEIHPGIRRWQTLTVEPGSAPFRSLAVQLAVAAGIPVADREDWIEKTVARWTSAPDGVRTSLETLFADAKDPLLVFIDQFEELFTHRKEGGKSEAIARNFVANLEDIWRNGGNRVRVVVALRADFVERCLEIGPLKELLQDRTMLIGEVGDDALREIVKGPAARVGAFLEKGLMERILTEVRSQSGSLPLLQQALHELWRHRRGAWLTHDAFDESGGVARALNDQAQGAYRSLDDAQKVIADSLFPRLITLGEGVSDTRRRVRRKELYPEGTEPGAVNEVIEKLSGKDARILVTTREGGSAEDLGSGEDFVEFTHEALLGNWEHLVKLLESERESIREHRTLTTAAEEWESKPSDEKHKFLLRAGQLVIAEQWAKDEGGYARLNQVERRFLDESIEERSAEESRKAKIARRLKLLSIGATAAAVVAMVVGGFALREKARADSERDEAKLIKEFFIYQLRSSRMAQFGQEVNVADEKVRDLVIRDQLKRAEIYDQLGDVFVKLGDLSKGEAHIRFALDIYENKANATTADERRKRDEGIAVSKSNLGLLLSVQGKFDEALDSFDDSLEIMIDLGLDEGKEPRFSATALRCMALYNSKGRWDRDKHQLILAENEATFERLQKARPEPVIVAGMKIAQAAAKFEEANSPHTSLLQKLDLATRAVELMEEARKYAEQTDELNPSRQGMKLYDDFKSYQDNEIDTPQFLKQVHESRNKLAEMFGHSNPVVLDVQLLIAMTAREAGEQERLMLVAVDASRKALGTEPAFAKYLDTYADILEKRATELEEAENNDEAKETYAQVESLLAEAIQLLERSFREEAPHWRVGQAHLKLGQFLKTQGKVPEAREHLTIAQGIFNATGVREFSELGVLCRQELQELKTD